MIETATIGSVSESSVSPHQQTPRITVSLPPKKRWRNQRTDVVVAAEPVRLPETSARSVRTRMKKSGQPHRIYPTVLAEVAPVAKPAMRLSIFSSFPWKENHWLPVGR